MVSETVSLVYGIICVGIIHLIILPISFYWIYQFWQTRDALIIKKRLPSLVVIPSISLYIYFLLACINIMIRREIDLPDEIDYWLHFIGDLAYEPLWWIYITIHACRFWLIFYMIKYNSAVLNNKWQSIIDPKTAQKNWYLENKDKWGNWKYIRYWVIGYCIIAWICTNLIHVTAKIRDAYAEEAFRSSGELSASIFSFIIPIMFDMTILCKIPKFDDDIGISKELKSSLYMIMTVMFLSILMNAWSITWRNLSDSWDDNKDNIISYTGILIIRFVLFLNTLRLTRWPLTTFKKIIVDRHTSTTMFEIAHQTTYDAIAKQSIELHQNSEDMSNITKNNNMERDAVMLRKEMMDSLKNNAIFDALMLHLLNEYCGECLLSIIEMTQFKQKIIEQNQTERFAMIDMIELPVTLVRSYIVYGDEDPNYISNYKFIANKLYTKYIAVGSEWEINIDFHNREKYTELFEDDGLSGDNIQALYKLFDPCIDIMSALLLSSFTRFKNSKKYEMIQHHSSPRSSPPLGPLIPKLGNVMKILPSLSPNNSSNDPNKT